MKGLAQDCEGEKTVTWEAVAGGMTVLQSLEGHLSHRHCGRCAGSSDFFSALVFTVSVAGKDNFLGLFSNFCFVAKEIKKPWLIV